MTKIKPFNNDGFTVMHNVIFDYMMPNLSPAAWKVLSVAIRLTTGWNKAQDKISYSQFVAKCGKGVKSEATLSKALKECLGVGYLVRIQSTEKTSGTCKASFFYSVNRDIEITTSENTPTSENEVGSTSENEVGSTSIIEDTTIQENKPQGDEVYTYLISLGVSKAKAKKHSQNWKLKHVQQWADYIATLDGIKNPAGLLVSKLDDGEVYTRDSGQLTGKAKIDAQEKSHQQRILDSLDAYGIEY